MTLIWHAIEKSRTIGLFLGALALSLTLSVAASQTAGAQGKIDPRSMSKAKWYEAPREIQILDERPVVHDFREGPQHREPTTLPPAPGGGRVGGRGAGALSDSPPSIDGMHIGNDGRLYRLPQEINPNSVPLEKAGFNRSPSNIPSGGIHPLAQLPAGYTTGIGGKTALPKNLVAPRQPQKTPVTHSAPARTVQSGPGPAPLLKYNHDYEPSVGSSTGAGGANTSVKAVLVTRRLLDKVGR